jgi:hypothetical protein
MSGSIPPAASSCIMSAVPDRGTPVTTVTNPGSEDSRVATSAQSRKRERSADDGTRHSLRFPKIR